MTLSIITRDITDQFGNLLEGAVVTVRQGHEPGGPLAELFSDPAGGTAVSNPVTAASGTLLAYAQPGRYRLEGTSSAGSGVSLVDTAPLSGKQYPTRDAFVSDVAEGYGPSNGTVVTAGGLQYVRTSWATWLLGLPGWLPFGEVTVNHFGAVGDWDFDTQTGTDSAEAFNTCRQWMLSTQRRGKGKILSGKYRLGSTFDIEGAGVWFEGESGEKSTVLVGDHNTGPVVRIWNRFSGISGVEIAASDARKAGAAHEGIRVESQNTPGRRVEQAFFRDVTIYDQPGDGFLSVGGNWRMVMNNMRIYSNNGHGISFDNGSTTGRVDVQNPGQVNMFNIEVWNNGGHALQIGNDNSVSNRGFRFHVVNFDAYRNAVEAGTRKTPTQAWLFCDTSTFENCAWDGRNLAGDIVTGGIRVYGRAVSFRNNRFLSVAGTCVSVQNHLSYQTEGIDIINPWVFGTPPADIVTQDHDARNVVLELGSETNVPRPVNTVQVVERVKRPRVISKSVVQTVNNSTTLVNDDDLKLRAQDRERIQFRFFVLYRGPEDANIKLAVYGPPGTTLSYGVAGGIKVDTSGAVVPQSAVFGGGSEISYGTAAFNSTRVAEIVGELITNGTGGEFGLQWAQDTATAGDTQILARSYLTALRH